MIFLMKRYYPMELAMHKAELIFFGIFYILLELMHGFKDIYFWIWTEEKGEHSNYSIFCFKQYNNILNF